MLAVSISLIQLSDLYYEHKYHEGGGPRPSISNPIYITNLQKMSCSFSTPGLQFSSFYHTIMSFFSFSTFPEKEYIIIFYASSHLPLSHHFDCVVFSLLFLEYGDHGVGTSWPKVPTSPLPHMSSPPLFSFPLVCFSFLRLSWNSKHFNYCFLYTSSLNY